jgi:peptidoglycan hydrolase CwlO-like protein
MELTITLALSILASVMSVSNFVLTRKDKALKEKGEQDNIGSNQKLIDYRLKKLEDKLDKILDKLDDYDKEISEKIDTSIKEAIDLHIKLYHKGEN